MKRKLLFAALLSLVVGGVKAQTDVTSTYIGNAGFEGESSSIKANSSRYIYQPAEWTVSYTNGDNQWDSSGFTNGQDGITYGFDPKNGSKAYMVRLHAQKNNQQITLSQTKTLPRGQYTLTGWFRTQNQNELEVGFYLGTYNNSNRVKYTGGNGAWKRLTKTFTQSTASEQTIGVFFKHTSTNTMVAAVDSIILLYEPFATDDDYTALDAAISTIEGSLGFDAGEYAPYNVASALATAKAIDHDADNTQSSVQNATAALEALTTNVTEVNAVNNGNFSEDFASSGWTVSDWGQKKTFSGTYTSAWRNNPGNIQYGTKGYYKMPLKANTYYTLHVAYCKHDNPSSGDRVTASVKNGDDGMASTDWGWTTSTDTWTEGTETFKTGTEGNYILKLQNSYNTCITGVTLFRATVAEVKAVLNTELTAANTLYNSGVNVGTGVFQIPTASGTAFSSAIETAQGVYDNGSATLDEFADAIADLQAAKTTYANATLNAPDSEKRYHLTVVRDGKAWDGYAITFMEGAANPTQGNYGIKYLTPANANMCQAVKFANTSGNKYKVSFLTPAGTEQYITTSHLGYNAGTDNLNKERIRTVDDAEKALEIEIQATTTANQFRLYNTDRGAVIADNDNNDVFTNNSANFTIAEASKATVGVNVGSGKFATRIFPFKPSAIDGITYYSCAAVDGANLTLVEVAEGDLAANTPYILEASKNVDETLEGYGVAKTNTYTAGLLTGVYTTASITADANNYVLQTQAGKQAFYLVSASGDNPFTTATPYRAYLTYSAGGGEAPKRLNFVTESSAINDIAIEDVLNGGAIYNVAGQRMQTLRKGINIVNGKKILVK